MQYQATFQVVINIEADNKRIAEKAARNLNMDIEGTFYGRDRSIVIFTDKTKLQKVEKR